jgi:alkylation response protein AidB-like acyl-CoA dehydrogenase
MIVFENVQVPVENLIGNEGKGFNYIVVNFNHERLLMANQGIALARTCVEECMKFSHRRKTFGKKLIEHPVIRLKLANMVR